MIMMTVVVPVVVMAMAMVMVIVIMIMVIMLVVMIMVMRTIMLMSQVIIFLLFVGIQTQIPISIMWMYFRYIAIILMAMRSILVLSQALIILAKSPMAWLIILQVLTLKWLLTTLLTHQSMRMGARPMQNKIHYYVDWETANCNNKHDHWFLDKFFVNYSCSRLVYEEGSQRPYKKQIAQSPQKLHSMKTKAHLVSRFFLRLPNKNKSHNKSNQIGDKMKGITNY